MKPRTNKQVFVLGATNIDFKMTLKEYPQLGQLKVSDNYEVDAGGKANGQACALAKLRIPTYFISCIGTKCEPGKTDDGDLIDIKNLSCWEEVGLHTEFVNKLPGRTGVTLITVVGTKNTICEYMGNNEKITREQIDHAFKRVNPGDFFLTTYEAKNHVDYALEEAKKRKMITFLSPAPIPEKINRLDLVDYIVVYEQELREISGIDIEGGKNNVKIGQAYKFFVHSDDPNEKRNKDIILIVCLGPDKGSIFVRKGLLVLIPSPKIKIVDKTLCRGAFIGAFVSCVAQNKPLEDCLKYANHASAFCSMTIGSIAALPKHEDVEKNMEDYPEL